MIKKGNRVKIAIALLGAVVLAVLVIDEVETGAELTAYFYFGFLLYWGVSEIKALLRFKKEKKQLELLYLKQQVHPHFFFNMLNNLYGLISIDTEKAKALVLKLSELMRFSLYEGEKDRIPLDKEMEFLENFMDLHRMRYQKTVLIECKKEGDIASVSVPPLMLLLLIENAFKHGVEKLRANAYVKLHVRVSSGVLLVEVENNFDPEQDNKPDGIGLDNLKKRLLMQFPNRHSLVLKHENSIYNAKLTLQV